MRTHRTHPKERDRAGFTLVELLVVVGIIGILAALLMPAIISAWRKAHETRTLTLIQQYEAAAQSFFNDYGDYPPSTWAEVDEFFEVPNPDLTNPLWAGGLFSDIAGTHGFKHDTSNPSIINQGIEVFTACLATRNGGPYLDLTPDQLGNTDGDSDSDNPNPPQNNGINDIRETTNWYFGGNQVFEIVDWWGNPLVYVHNREYAWHDGWDETVIPPGPAFEAPQTYPPAALTEAVYYTDAENNTVPCYARWDDRAGRDGTAVGAGVPLVTMNYPNLTSFQLYSWGPDLQPGCAQSATNPGTPNQHEPGFWPGWIGRSRNLTNWQE